jgi:hypothetical protein
MNLARIVAAAALVAALSACSKPVPPDKGDFVGEWQAPQMYLLLTQDGSVNYVRLKGGAKTTVTAGLQKFEGDNFVVGLGFLSTTFVVSKPPYKDGANWKMVVDGVELTKGN